MKSALPQHSLSAFHDYLPTINHIIQSFPHETLINPSPLSPRTYIARIRDAINSMALNDYTTPLFTLERAREIFHCLHAEGPFIFTHEPNNYIRCGMRRKRSTAGQLTITNTVVNLTPGTINGQNNDIFLAVLLLKKHDLITDPVTFINLSDSQLAEATSTPNIECFEVKPQHHVLI